jgi:phage baseplate assembly protein W
MTNLGERLFQPNVGSDVYRALFDPNDVIAAENLTFYIKNTLTHNEPRIILLNVKVIPYPDNNSMVVNIIFSLINSNVPVTLDVILKRVR